MKSKVLGQAMVVMMGAFCTVPAYSAPKAGDFIIGCKLFMKNSAGTRFYVRSTATNTQSGRLELTSSSTSATVFAFLRRETYTEDANGTVYVPVPRGECMGFTSGTQATHRATVQVSNCDNMSKISWIVDARPTTAEPNAFVMRLVYSNTKFLNADNITAGTPLIIYDQPITSAFSTQKFYTSGCKYANNGSFAPRGGT